MNRFAETYRTSGLQAVLNLAIAALLALGLMVSMGAAVNAQGEDAVDGYIYTVQDGDSWDSVAAKTGVSVETLQTANPSSVRASGWLLSNEKLTVPYVGGESKSHKVTSGESWSSIADEYGVDIQLLKAANPQAIRSGLVLYVGEEFIIPPAADEIVEVAPVDLVDEEAAEEVETDDPAEEAADVDESEPAVDAGAETVVEEAEGDEAVDAGEADSETVEAVETEAGDDVAAESEASEEDSAETESEDSASEEEAAVEEETPVTEEDAAAGEEDAVDEAPVVDIACPEVLADYPGAVLAQLNGQGGDADALEAFLVGCEAQVDGGVVAVDLTGDGQDEFVVVYQNPNQESSFIESDLVIIAAGAAGYDVAYRARAAGEVRLLATEDINLDGLADVVWADTTCGASTCFDTVNVRSWDGSAWADWTEGTITMAYADIDLADVLEDGDGQEIQLTGGIYGSVGAGPQRSRTELWISVEGGPYTLASKTYSDSECLYHTVLDANKAMADIESPDNLATAKALYEKAATDESLIKCWVRPAELEELRSFSLFRLALIEAYGGNLESAVDRITELAATYPEGVMTEAGDVWLNSVDKGDTLDAACEAVTAFAEENPEVWEILADYGYTNPSFAANDLCPPPQASDDDTEETATDGATGASPRSDLGDETAAEGQPESEAAVETEDAEDLPDCPVSLVAYEAAIAGAVEELGGEIEQIEAWLESCGALSADRGALETVDVNGDGVDDFVVYPTIVSDVGLGPEGAQGAVHILHSNDEGGYDLIASPQVFGEPKHLAIDDLNADGRLDIAWTVEGCSTFCVLETQIVTWDGEAYTSLVEPGAAIASGEATFAPVEDGDLGDGLKLVMSGGVSGTPEGGLTVDHVEEWQSIGGAPYTLLSWTYDRNAAGSDCTGLRLVEADVALQASDVLGYEPAIAKYTEALSPEMTACSIFGLNPEDEVALLQGLASFRLIQTEALSGDLASAQSSLDLRASGMPENLYAGAAQQWLTEYIVSGDAASACEAVASIMQENPDLWQITDHYGYNHPALAAEQICFAPEK